MNDLNNLHSHGAAAKLDPQAVAIVQRGLDLLIQKTDDLAFKPLRSERFPLPVTKAISGGVPKRVDVVSRIRVRAGSDPVAALEDALVLFELMMVNDREVFESVPDDDQFLGLAFSSKRLNGWITQLGDTDCAEIGEAVNARWQFKLIDGPGRLGGFYLMLNMLFRYGFVYGRIDGGDSHAMGHFIEDFGPGLLVCRGEMSELELTLSLAAMKLGVPAIVAPDYPFELGRRATADGLEEIVSGVTLFPNIRKLLDLPDLPKLPVFLDPGYANEEFEAAAKYGATEESYYILRKGEVSHPGTVEVLGESGPAMGVDVTSDAEPLDASDRQYIEARAARAINMLSGVRGRLNDGRLIVELGPGQAFDAARLGETLIAAIRHEFPKIENISVRLSFDADDLAARAGGVRNERVARREEITSMTEESVDEFATCVGCSPFAPDHVCILTPERRPQCGRPYAQIRTGALYGYDDMSNIHHRGLHSGLNSFGMTPKGEVLDVSTGEWSGVNDAANRLTGGRTKRVQLHSIDTAPHTGCGCFQLIMFKTDAPRAGTGVMDRSYAGTALDGRSWRDLHYDLGGKQAPGLAGAATNYLRSGKFLAAHGGWGSVVWVSPKIATLMGDDLPAGVEIGEEAD